MEIFLFWVVLSIIVGMWAGSRGRSGGGWFVIAVLLSPLLAFLILLVIGKNDKAVEAQALADGNMRKCPKCAELIKAEAVKCRYCGSDVEIVASSGVDTVSEDSDPTDAETLMAKYDIQHDAGKFKWRVWSYDRLEDAVANARHTLAQERAKYG